MLHIVGGGGCVGWHPRMVECTLFDIVFLCVIFFGVFCHSINTAIQREWRGSITVNVWTEGDMLGPSVNGLDKLIKMPYGCGEQNMLNFAPNIYIRRYLETTGQLTNDIVDKSQRYMMAGTLYQLPLIFGIFHVLV